MYLDLVRPEAAVQRLQFADIAPRAADFTATEWRVIGLSRADGLGSLGRRSRFVGWLRRAAGLSDPNPLADPRLETLRHVCVLIRNAGRAPHSAEIDLLIAAGFTLAQVALLGQLFAAA